MVVGEEDTNLPSRAVASTPQLVALLLGVQVDTVERQHNYRVSDLGVPGRCYARPLAIELQKLICSTF